MLPLLASLKVCKMENYFQPNHFCLLCKSTCSHFCISVIINQNNSLEKALEAKVKNAKCCCCYYYVNEPFSSSSSHGEAILAQYLIDMIKPAKLWCPVAFYIYLKTMCMVYCKKLLR